MALSHLLRRNRYEKPAAALYAQVVGQARQPAFYARLGVPDTLDGRFELLALHGFLVLHRLKGERAAAAGLAQALFDTMFADMDRCLREMGAGDLGVGPRVKRMAQGFYGRIAAYDAALGTIGRRGSEDPLAAALRRNLYGTAAPTALHLAAMAGYVRREADSLARQPAPALAAGQLSFGPPPELATEA